MKFTSKEIDLFIDLLYHRTKNLNKICEQLSDMGECELESQIADERDFTRDLKTKILQDNGFI